MKDDERNSIFEEMECAIESLEQTIVKLRLDFKLLQGAATQISEVAQTFSSANARTERSSDLLGRFQSAAISALHSHDSRISDPYIAGLAVKSLEQKLGSRGNKDLVLELLTKNVGGLIRADIAKQLKTRMGVVLNAKQLSNTLYYLVNAAEKVVRESDGRYRLK